MKLSRHLFPRKKGKSGKDNLGTPYELIIKRLIDKGYAGNQTEVIRQALMFYERSLEEEEVNLVNRGIMLEMEDVREGILKTKSLEELEKKYSA